MHTNKIATAADIPQITAVAMQVWPQTYTPIVGATQVAYMLARFYAPQVLQRQMETEGHTFFLCSYNGQPVGFAAWQPLGSGLYKLHKIYIALTQQGQGTGRYLLGAVVAAIKEKGGHTLRLNVNRHNHNAIGFYKKMGFITVAEEDIAIGDGYYMNDYVLDLEL